MTHTQTITPCRSIDCPNPATHYSRRFGPESPYCRPCASWADGISPTNRDFRVAPLVLPEGPRLGSPLVVTLG